MSFAISSDIDTYAKHDHNIALSTLKTTIFFPNSVQKALADDECLQTFIKILQIVQHTHTHHIGFIDVTIWTKWNLPDDLMFHRNF